jgi:cytochrome c oxidase cbb3-type subunit 3
MAFCIQTNIRRLSVGLAGLCAWLLAGLPIMAAGSESEGKRLYDFYCYQCHAYSGTGQTVAARTLNPPPRDFTSERARALSREQLLDAVRNGRPGTGMVGFGEVMGEAGVQAVVDYLIEAFMSGEVSDARYHTPANGWPNHERYAVAFPFARGEIPLDTPDSALTEKQLRGKRLFLSGCVTCHDSGVVNDLGPVWETRAVSFPRGVYDHRNPPTGAGPADAISGATPYLRHELAPPLPEDSDLLRRGEAAYQDNCAFCHAPNGTGQNWIGSFLEPHPRDLTDPAVMQFMSPQRLEAVIREGLPDTSMPAWNDVLEDAQIAALMHYIDRVFHPLASATGEFRIDTEASKAALGWQRVSPNPE